MEKRAKNELKIYPLIRLSKILGNVCDLFRLAGGEAGVCERRERMDLRLFFLHPSQFKCDGACTYTDARCDYDDKEHNDRAHRFSSLVYTITQERKLFILSNEAHVVIEKILC
jgi:hypothetical protein